MKNGKGVTTRRQIVEHTALVLCQDGATDLTVAPLMARIGMTHGALYGHFASIDELVANAVRWIGSISCAAFESGVLSAPSLAAVDSYFASCFDSGLTSVPDSGYSLLALAPNARLLGPESLRSLAAELECFSHLLARGLLALGATGECARTATCSVMAEVTGSVLLGGIYGANALHLDLRERTLSAVQRRIRDAIAICGSS